MIPLLRHARRFRVADPARACHAVTDAALVTALGATLVGFGGRHPAGTLLYSALVAVAALATALRAHLLPAAQRPRRVAPWLAAAAMLLLALQVTPLPGPVLEGLAPKRAELFPAWGDQTALEPWRTFSVAPAETLAGLALLVTHTLLFFVIAQRLESSGDIRRMLLTVGLTAVAAALLAGVLRLAPSERLLGVYDSPTHRFDRGVQGTFANRNHLAHFLALGVAAWSPWLLASANRAATKPRTPAERLRAAAPALAAVAVAVTAAVLLATQSRGGAAALAAVAMVAVTLRALAGGVRLTEGLSFVAVAALSLGALSLFGYDEVTGRLDDLVSGEVETLDADARRRLIWEANLKAFAASPVLGSGAGAHRHFSPAYLSTPTEKEFTHAESGYFQIASECGAAGLAILAVAGALCVRWLGVAARGDSRPETVRLVAALGAGLAASFLHSAVDFVWYVPVLAGVAVAMAAGAMRLAELAPCSAPCLAASHRWPPALGLALGAGFAVATLWPSAAASPAWDGYLRSSKSIRALEAKHFACEPGEEDPLLPATIRAVTERSVEQLRAVVRRNPSDARAHARLAGRLLQEFDHAAAGGENPMTVGMIADTVAKGGFGSPAEVRAWLHRAFGDDAQLLEQARAHALAAVRLGPLLGESYLQLASLAFLDSEPMPLELLVRQATVARPLDGRVRFEAGRLEHLAGRVDEAFDAYRASLRLPGSHRGRLVGLLSPVLAAEEFLAEFEPDCAATDLVLAAYRRDGTVEDLNAIAEHAEKASLEETADLTPREAARRWRQVSAVNRSLGRWERAVECAERAGDLQPHDFNVRHELAFAYYQAGRLADADPHLRWCLARRPDLRYLQATLQAGSKARVAESWRSKRTLGMAPPPNDGITR